MREGDERAVIALKVRQFLKVVGGLVAAVFAILFAVVDPIKGNLFSIVALEGGNHRKRGFIFTFFTVLLTVVGPGKRDFSSVVAHHGRDFVSTFVVSRFVGTVVAVVNAVVDPTPWDAEVFPVDGALAGVLVRLVISAEPFLSVISCQEGLVLSDITVDDAVVEFTDEDIDGRFFLTAGYVVALVG